MSLLWPLLLVPTLPGPPVTAASASTQRGQGPVRSLGLRSPSAWGGAALPARPARVSGAGTLYLVPLLVSGGQGAGEARDGVRPAPGWLGQPEPSVGMTPVHAALPFLLPQGLH